MGTVSRPQAAVVFPLLDAATDSGSGMRTLVDAGIYDIRRVAVGPRQTHGPGRNDGDACVLVLEGSVEFTVDGGTKAVALGEMLWVPAGATRGFVAGDDGAVLLALHLPRGPENDLSNGPDVDPEDAAVIAQVTAHHARMSARLDLLTAAVAGPCDAVDWASALRSLANYWRHEILPHAAAEEGTIYAEARQIAGGAALIAALVMEHEHLSSHSHALAELAGPPLATTPERDGSAAIRPGEATSRAATQAAVAAALFHLHARKENEVVLPALVAAGRALPPILARMEQAFALAKEGLR